MDPFKIKVGTVTIDEPYTDRYLDESAHRSSKTAYTLEPGVYDVYMAFYGHYETETAVFETAEIPGVITEDADATSQRSLVGTNVCEKININPNDVESGVLKLNIEVPYLAMSEKGGYPMLSLDTDHKEFHKAMEERDRFDFKRLFAEVEPRKVAYAEKHGFMEGDKLTQGMQMGTMNYGTMILYDQHLRQEFGGGLEEFGVSFDDVMKHGEGKWGNLDDIFKEVTQELNEKYDFKNIKVTENTQGYGQSL